AAFRPDPYNLRASPRQRRDRPAAQQQIDTVQALERDAQPGLIQQGGTLLNPPILNAHDVIHEPDVIGGEIVFEPAYLLDDVLGAADVVLLAPDRLGAPVAVERAAPCRDQIHAEVAVSFEPQPAILLIRSEEHTSELQ